MSEPTPGTAPLRRPAARRFTVLLPVLGVSVLGLCGLVLLGLGAANVGVLPVLVGSAAALIPVGPVVAAFLWVDRWEPEPARLLLIAFAWGALIATVTALVLNDTAEVLGDLVLGKGTGDTVGAVFSAPFVEEAAKGLIVVGLLIYRRNEFDGIVDGIVYAGISAAGFAFTENIYYFGLAFAKGGLGSATGGVVAVFILRGVLAPFTHPLFTAMTGIGLGIAARTRIRQLRVVAPLLGYLGAVCLHALWNGSATLGGAATFIDVYFLVMVPIFFAALWFVVWHRRREQRIVAAELPAMVRHGWIAPSEVELLASLPGRRKWRARVRKRSGRAAARAVGDYQVAVTELAFHRSAVRRQTVGTDAEQRGLELVATLVAARERAVVGGSA